MPRKDPSGNNGGKSRWSLGIKHLKGEVSEEGRRHVSFAQIEQQQLERMKMMGANVPDDTKIMGVFIPSSQGERTMEERVHQFGLGMGTGIEANVNKELASFNGGEFKGLVIAQSGFAWFGFIVYVPTKQPQQQQNHKK